MPPGDGCQAEVALIGTDLVVAALVSDDGGCVVTSLFGYYSSEDYLGFLYLEVIAQGGKNLVSDKTRGREVDTCHMYQAYPAVLQCVTTAVVAASSLVQVGPGIVSSHAHASVAPVGVTWWLSSRSPQRRFLGASHIIWCVRG